jgi:hypothetical protein
MEASGFRKEHSVTNTSFAVGIPLLNPAPGLPTS